MSTTTVTREADFDVLTFSYLVAGNAQQVNVDVCVHDANPDAPDEGRLITIGDLSWENPLHSHDVIRLIGVLSRALELSRTAP